MTITIDISKVHGKRKYFVSSPEQIRYPFEFDNVFNALVFVKSLLFSY